jgi:hypothetical protein
MNQSTDPNIKIYTKQEVETELSRYAAPAFQQPPRPSQLPNPKPRPLTGDELKEIYWWFGDP